MPDPASNTNVPVDRVPPRMGSALLSRSDLRLLLLFVVLLVGAAFLGWRGQAATRPPVHIASGGLGLTRAEWESDHTLLGSNENNYGYARGPLSTDRHQVYYVNYWYYSEPSGPDVRVSSLDFDVADVLSGTQQVEVGHGPVTLEQQHAVVRRLLPADAQYLGSQDNPRSRYGDFDETYHSKSLEGLYGPLPTARDPWGGEPPGIIHVSLSRSRSYALIVAGERPVPPPPTATPVPTSTRVINLTPEPPGVPTKLRDLLPGVGTRARPIPVRSVEPAITATHP